MSLKIDGRVVDERAWFAGELAADGGSGISNPLGADIRFVVRTHRPAIPGRVEEQPGSANGGCDVDITSAMPVAQGECSSVASASHTGG